VVSSEAGAADPREAGAADPLHPGAADPEAYYPGSLGRAHPGPERTTLPRWIRDAIVAHARVEVPNEACGIVIGDRPAASGGSALRWAPLRNPLASPFRYAIDPDDLLRLTIETDDADEVFWAIVHSHTASPARPSPTDLRESHYPDSLYLLVSLDPAEADTTSGDESVRAWRIVDGGVHEVELRVDADA
jgi:proteasome lid subunit RPN8/RPN11